MEFSGCISTAAVSMTYMTALPELSHLCRQYMRPAIVVVEQVANDQAMEPWLDEC